MDDKPIFKGRGPGVPGAFTGEEVVSEETIKELARRINSGQRPKWESEPVGLVSPELYNHVEKLLKENPDIPWQIS
jgi:hypothetical protein